jgi:hypothetical protein
MTTEKPADRVKGWIRQRSWIDALSYVLILAGLIAGLSWHVGWLALAAAGAFGPVILRALHLVDDVDELQRRAADASGHRAYVAGGLAVLGLMIARGRGQPERPPEVDLLFGVLMVMLVVYFVTYALSFWDARRAVTRILLAFGLFWLAFVLLSHAGAPVAALVEGITVPLPFLLAAWLGRRWPVAVGTLLVAASAAMLVFFHLLPGMGGDGSDLLVVLVLPLPLLVAGLALIGSRRQDASVS